MICENHAEISTNGEVFQCLNRVTLLVYCAYSTEADYIVFP